MISKRAVECIHKAHADDVFSSSYTTVASPTAHLLFLFLINNDQLQIESGINETKNHLIRFICSVDLIRNRDRMCVRDVLMRMAKIKT